MGAHNKQRFTHMHKPFLFVPPRAHTGESPTRRMAAAPLETCGWRPARCLIFFQKIRDKNLTYLAHPKGRFPATHLRCSS